MANKKSLLKSAAFSCLAMGLSAAVIAGTTFAWFTDRATTPENKIVAGNLKVQLQYNSAAEGEEAKWESSEFHALFEDTDLWEPGKMVVSEPFRVANVGSLALWYDLSVEMKDEVTVKIDGVEHGLSEVVKCKMVKADEAPTGENRAEEWAAASSVFTSGKLVKEDATDAMVAVLYWQPTDYDNDYNVDVDAKPLETHFFISVLASQIPEESDSFGPDYDKDAVDSKQIVIDTVTAGVEKMNAIMKTEDGEFYASLSDLKEVEANVYETTVSMDAKLAETVSISRVFNDIGATLFSEVAAKSALIKSIAFTANDKPVTEDGTVETNGEEITGDDLVFAIANGCLKNLETSLNGNSTIKELNGEKLQVVITTIDGETVTYNLPFVITAASYVKAAVVEGAKTAQTMLSELEGLTEGASIEMSDLVDNKATVYFGSCKFEDFFKGYQAVSYEIETKVYEQMEAGNITSITIAGEEADLQDGAWLTNGLFQWGMQDLLTPGERAKVLSTSNVGEHLTLAATYMASHLNGQSCDVTITSSDGVTVVYTLSFVINDTAKVIKAAVADGVNTANNALMDKGLGDKIIISELDKNNKSTCTFKTDDINEVIAGALAVGNAIYNAVTENRINIAAIAIDGRPANLEDDNWLIDGLKAWLEELMGDGEAHADENTFKVLDGAACDVTITTTDGVETTYTLAFAFEF